MIVQTIFQFKLETTGETLTARSGLALMAEYQRGLGLGGLVRRHLPAPGSNRGYEARVFVEALVVMLQGGGRDLEDVRELAAEEGLMRLGGAGRRDHRGLAAADGRQEERAAWAEGTGCGADGIEPADDAETPVSAVNLPAYFFLSRDLGEEIRLTSRREWRIICRISRHGAGGGRGYQPSTVARDGCSMVTHHRVIVATKR